ncbi:EamA family transporter [Sedimentibacter hydroxybenzoicus DSM 7310]|uniref:EamA family transporter n=1 Tax=Sedimentibacter hydroxybenzoicus DSM 7310 TaxID=1123245 RepID=A0A974GXA7_SEDHY|nr:DMT family transporter [Sedimentibacter hydroxybenzoicus]NYB75021.1 EamA family transporter [Sedimentibacter hydroxybenzoicus DSM 7310]
MKTAYLKYISALLMFGSNGIVASYILLSSYEIVFLRTLIGSMFLILIFLFSKTERMFWKNKSHSMYLIISGIAMGASWIFLYEAYSQIGVSIATLSYYCGPVIIMILSPVLFKERLANTKLLGFFAVIIGMFFVNYQALSQGIISWGLILSILSAIMYAIMVVFNKKAVSITGLENSMYQLVTSFFAVAIFVGIKQGFSIDIVHTNLPAILLLGVVNTGIGCYFYFSSIDDLPVQTVSICGYLEPLSALIFSAAILGEKLGALQIAGAILILGGAAFGELAVSDRSLR